MPKCDYIRFEKNQNVLVGCVYSFVFLPLLMGGICVGLPAANFGCQPTILAQFMRIAKVSIIHTFTYFTITKISISSSKHCNARF